MSLDEKQICSECVGEVFLSAKIEREGKDGACSYCATTGKVFSLDEMANEIQITFEEHFYRTASEPSDLEYAMSKESDYGWEREGDRVVDVLQNYVEISSKAAEDIQSILEDRTFDFEAAKMGEENPFDKDAQYAESGVDDRESHAGWTHFETSLKTEARYFSRTGEETLRSTFDGLAEHKTEDGRPIIVDAGPGLSLAALYRARVFQSFAKLEAALKRPDIEIGPPPSAHATSGRMNAHGISVFYGATDPMVALAEIRPPVASTVVVGRFELVRPVRLLDVEALRSVYVSGSIFDREFIHRLARGKFLKWLSQRIVRPVMPDDQPFDYLATQAIADFLATDAKPPLDGIIYPSVQGKKGQCNVVLFHKAARIQRMDIPKGTRIAASLYNETEDGPETDYWVWEEVPPEVTPAPPKPEDFLFSSESLDSIDFDAHDYRDATLKLDVESVKVHHVNAISFTTEDYPVRRHRTKK